MKEKPIGMPRIAIAMFLLSGGTFSCTMPIPDDVTAPEPAIRRPRIRPAIEPGCHEMKLPMINGIIPKIITLFLPNLSARIPIGAWKMAIVSP